MVIVPHSTTQEPALPGNETLAMLERGRDL